MPHLEKTENTEIGGWNGRLGRSPLCRVGASQWSFLQIQSPHKSPGGLSASSEGLQTVAPTPGPFWPHPGDHSLWGTQVRHMCMHTHTPASPCPHRDGAWNTSRPGPTGSSSSSTAGHNSGLEVFEEEESGLLRAKIRVTGPGHHHRGPAVGCALRKSLGSQTHLPCA